MNFRAFLESTVVFHGAKSKVEDWSKPQAQRSGYYPGVYAATDPELTKRFGSNLYGIEVDHDKFYDLSDPKAADELKREADRAGYPISQGSGWPESRYLKDKGYQGIRRGGEYIIFNPLPSTPQLY